MILQTGWGRTTNLFSVQAYAGFGASELLEEAVVPVCEAPLGVSATSFEEGHICHCLVCLLSAFQELSLPIALKRGPANGACVLHCFPTVRCSFLKQQAWYYVYIFVYDICVYICIYIYMYHIPAYAMCFVRILATPG